MSDPVFSSIRNTAMTTRPLFAALAAATLLSGCSLVPDYLRPEAPVPAAWPAGAGPAAPAKPEAPLLGDMAWKEFFTAPSLQYLIGQALENNRDLRVAALNIDVARSTYRVSESDLFPHLTAGASGTADHSPKSVSSANPPKASDTRRFNANLGITSFEVDLFGRLSSLEEESLEKYLATEEARDSTRISLIAEVANAALTLFGDRALLKLTNETLDSRQASLELILRSFERGAASQLDVAQARTAVETARVNRSRYLRQVEQDKNALVLLVGAPIDESRLDAVADDLGGLHFVEDLPTGLPSEVLLRRPDIVQAEHTLKAANANIGAARAAFFPTLSLTGTFGSSSATLDTLFAAGTGAWSFVPQITTPIFDAGKNFANLDSAKANRDIAIAQYEKSIQTAFSEVANALTAKTTLSEQMKSQSDLVAATRDSYRLSRARYDSGIDSYLNVLDSQRSLYSAEQDLISVQISRLSNLVTLYKVLGGGVS
jgi:multidrug efflux system outer membrane protein